MAEALGLVASIIAVVQISGTVISICDNYQNALKKTAKDIERLREGVVSLKELLEELATLLRRENLPKAHFDAIQKKLTSSKILTACETELEGLEKKLRSRKGIKGIIRAFKQETTEAEVSMTILRIDGYKSTLTFALMIGQFSVSLDIQETSQYTQSLVQYSVAGVKENEYRQLLDWLQPHDVIKKHETVSMKRYTGTGQWILKDPKFVSWKENHGSALWLTGIPGCGKTVLSSAVIDSLTHQIPTNSDVGVAYFYFDFAIPSSTPYERLLSSLIWQLSLVSTKAAQILEDFYRKAIKVDTAHWTRQLAEKQRSIGVDQSVTLINCIIQSFARVYIVVDALDECSERGKLLQLLKTFWEKKPANVSCFLASRRESEIEDSVNTIADYHITCHGTIVDGDIRKYIQHRLGSEKAFKQWPENTRSEVERTLYTKSQGMFRWTECQFDALQQCLAPKAVSLALTRLPKTLNEIYDRIISQIEEEYYDDAYRLLHWLIYAKRRMRLKELAEVLTINLEGDEPHFDVGNRLYRARSVLTICSSLISISGSEIIGHEEISLAHFSVKEFLESNAFTKHVDFTKAVDDPYRRGPRLWYSSPEELSVKSCLAYLIAIKDTRQERAEIIASFPLADYAAEFWARHAFDLHSCDPGLWRFAMQLLIRESDAFVNWVYIYDIEKPWLHHRRDAANGIKCDPRPLSPLYLCCLAGLPNLVNLLLNREDDPNEIGGIFGTPLHAACFVGCAPIVSALLNRKASPNRASGLMRFPLLAAAYQGHSGAVFALLKNNANIEVGDEVLGNALLLAAKGGHEEVVRLLVSRGLAVDQMIARCDSPLQGAIRVGHFGIVQYLVSERAQVLPYIVKTATTDCPSEEVRKFILQHERPFPDHRRASERQYREKDVTQLVSELGIKQPTTWSLSDLNCIFDSDRYTESSPLIAAAGQDNNQLLSDLLDQGININKKLEICLTERHPISLTALLLAASNGHEKAVTLLLRRNANPNVTAGVSPLQLAVYRGHLSIVRLLLGHSQPADVDYKGGPLGSALQAAVLLRDVEVFTEILGRTACVCGTAGLYANPLNAAVSIGSQEAVKLLLGFVPYPRPWKGRLTPCRIPMHCRFSTDQKIVALKTAMKLDLPNTIYLISKDLITTPNDSYILVENCLCLCRVAVELGNLIQLDVVLEQIKTFGEEDAYQNTLKGLFNVLFGQPENVDMIQYLLDHGADPNTRVERGFHSYDYECVLHFAVRQGRLATAKLLLDCGANPRGTGYGGSIKKLYANNWTMLHEAAVKGGRDFVQLLLKSDSGLLFERTAEKGRLPVHVACEYGNIDSFEEMIAHGVDINATDNTNATLMHVAVDFLRVELVKVLLQKGASTTARNENGLTPLELAMTKNRLGFYDAMVDADKKEEIIRLLSVLESSS